MIIKTYAKVNLFLDIKGVYDNGYHCLDSVMASIDLFDEMTIDYNNSGTVIIKIFDDNGNLIMSGDDNTIAKAIKLFCEKYCDIIEDNFGVNVSVTKRIPIGGGLGGSSSNAAGMLVALCKRYGVNIIDAKDIAVNIGSDVYYMCLGGTKRVKGLGDIVEELEFKPMTLLLAKPYSGVLTAECYKHYDEISLTDMRFCGMYTDYMKAKELGFLGLFYNALSQSAMDLNNEVRVLYEQCLGLENAIATVMSGSGSTIITLFDSLCNAQNAMNTIQGEYQKYVVNTVPFGVTFS